MQMIADGKIKEGQIINRLSNDGSVFKYEFICGKLHYNGTPDTLTSFYKIKTILEQNFEILEYKTKEIEEIKELDEWVTRRNGEVTQSEAKIIEIGNKLNELVRAVNKLNKQDTSKETNCMSE